MRQKSKRTKGIEQAHPFDGTPALHPQRGASVSKINLHAAGVDIGATEIVVCVAADETTQLVRGFGNYTVDLHVIADWLTEHQIKTVATPAPTAGAVWKAREYIGFRSLKFWKSMALNAC